MTKASERLEKQYRIPCGAMDIKADSVCRRSLRDSFDALLDRLTLEVNPEIKPATLPKGVQVGENNLLVEKPSETVEEKRQRLLEEGRLRAEVQAELKKYREQLQGNSKMLQDISGRYESI